MSLIMQWEQKLSFKFLFKIALFTVHKLKTTVHKVKMCNAIFYISFTLFTLLGKQFQ
jgi:hypothetical protein